MDTESTSPLSQVRKTVEIMIGAARELAEKASARGAVSMGQACFTTMLTLQEALKVIDDAGTQGSSPDDSTINDTFNGDNKHLQASIGALIRMNDEGALIPHGIGGHARCLLAACYHRLTT